MAIGSWEIEGGGGRERGGLWRWILGRERGAREREGGGGDCADRFRIPGGS